jgi:Na+-translocating ferredoxin:NAD+ oxidoreductase RnfD subunit
MNFLKSFFSSTSPYSIQGQNLINLSLFLIIGKLFLNLQVSWPTVFAVVIIAIIIEHTFLYLRDGKLTFFSVSSVLTALGLCFMLYADSIIIYTLLLIIAFAQKYALRLWGYHIFNPSNLAVSLGLLLFSEQHTYVAMGQWGHHWWLGVILLIFGGAILWRVKRLWMPITFLLIYVVLQLIFINTTDAFFTAGFLWQRIFAGSFLIYTVFMLTDPRTTPTKKKWQLIFVALTAILATLLDYVLGMSVENLFFSLTAVYALVPIMRVVSQEKNYGPKMSKTKVVLISLSLFIILMLGIFINSSSF